MEREKCRVPARRTGRCEAVNREQVFNTAALHGTFTGSGFLHVDAWFVRKEISNNEVEFSRAKYVFGRDELSDGKMAGWRLNLSSSSVTGLDSTAVTDEVWSKIKLPACQVASPFATSGTQVDAIVPYFLSGALYSLQVRADFLPVSADFVLAGAVANIVAQFGAVFSQLGVIPSQLVAALLHLATRVADGPEIVSNDRPAWVSMIAVRPIFHDIDHARSAVGVVPGKSVVV